MWRVNPPASVRAEPGPSIHAGHPDENSATINGASVTGGTGSVTIDISPPEARHDDHPGLLARFRAWLRTGRGERHPTLAETIFEEFSFLETQLGFQRAEVREFSMFTAVTWATARVTVNVTVDAREGLRVDVGRREPGSGHRAYDLFVIGYFREHGTLTDLHAELESHQSPRGTPDELHEIAVELRSHDRDLLRGDLALLDGLDGEYRRLL